MTNDEAPGALISAEELARLLPLSRQQIWRAVREKKLGHFRIGRRVFFDFEEIKATLRVPAGQETESDDGKDLE